jgi:hypothetical protein
VEGAPDKREIKRLERAITVDLARAHKRRDRASEAADRQLLVRLKKLVKKR